MAATFQTSLGIVANCCLTLLSFKAEPRSRFTKALITTSGSGAEGRVDEDQKLGKYNCELKEEQGDPDYDEKVSYCVVSEGVIIR